MCIRDRFYTAQPELETYRRSLYQLRRRAAHLLSPKEEPLLAAAGEMAGAPHRVFSLFSDADMKFPDALDSEGNAHQVTQGTYVACLKSPPSVCFGCARPVTSVMRTSVSGAPVSTPR